MGLPMGTILRTVASQPARVARARSLSLNLETPSCTWTSGSALYSTGLLRPLNSPILTDVCLPSSRMRNGSRNVRCTRNAAQETGSEFPGRCRLPCTPPKSAKLLFLSNDKMNGVPSIFTILLSLAVAVVDPWTPLRFVPQDDVDRRDTS